MIAHATDYSADVSTPHAVPHTLGVELLTKPWGGHRIGHLFGQPGAQFGEAWLCADLPQTSDSGAGGQAMVSRVDHPAFSGEATLQAWLARDPVGLLGYEAERFPLLLKLLDAARPLSVQVHPSVGYAAAHPGAHVKSEAWYILEAADGAELLAGVRKGVDQDTLRRAALAENVVPHLQRFTAMRHRCCWLPSGVVHALGAGTFVLEVQTASDTTYRLYDWARESGSSGRALHIEEATAAASPALQPRWDRNDWMADGMLAVTPDFSMRRLPAGKSTIAARLFGGFAAPRAVIVVPLSGDVHLSAGNSRCTLPTHRATIIPAAATNAWSIAASPDAHGVAIHVA